MFKNFTNNKLLKTILKYPKITMWDTTYIPTQDIMNRNQKKLNRDSLGLSIAGLLVYIARLDNDYNEKERSLILEILRYQEWDIQSTAESLLIQGETLSKEVLDCYEFLRIINNIFDEKECLKLMQMMWQVVIADGVIDEYEAHMMDRIAKLLSISNKDYKRIRHDT